MGNCFSHVSIDLAGLPRARNCPGFFHVNLDPETYIITVVDAETNNIQTVSVSRSPKVSELRRKIVFPKPENYKIFWINESGEVQSTFDTDDLRIVTYIISYTFNPHDKSSYSKIKPSQL
jgi:hypothetical protein